MTSGSRKGRSLPRVRMQRPNTNDDTGYGRPPRKHQFKPGKSGNPKGRPKGALNEATILRELLDRKIPIREGGKTRKITVLQAILLRFTEDSLRGNTKSAAFILGRQSALSAGEPQRADITDDDKEILAAFAERLTAQRTIKGSKT